MRKNATIVGASQRGLSKFTGVVEEVCSTAAAVRFLRRTRDSGTTSLLYVVALQHQQAHSVGQTNHQRDNGKEGVGEFMKAVRRTLHAVRGAFAPAQRQPIAFIAAFAVFTFAGLLFTSSALTARGTDLRSEQVGDLRDLIARRAADIAKGQRTISSLQEEVDALTADSQNPSLLFQIQRAEQLAATAGLTEVVGEGLQVVLDDAPRTTELPEGAIADDLVVHQRDVQAVVNALWRGGATAMQIMDQRVLSTSAVRCVGNTLILQGRVYSPPFVITAVGNLDRMQKSLDDDLDIQAYQEFVDLYGLGWDVRRLSDVRIPAWEGGVTFNDVRTR